LACPSAAGKVALRGKRFSETRIVCGLKERAVWPFLDEVKDSASKVFGATVVEAPAISERLSENLREFVGKRIGNYVIDRHLGVGGMAVVFAARHPALGREVAVKFLKPSLMYDPEVAARFLYEAKVTATLKHPNIVEILDFGEFEHRPYYMMELLKGEDLGARLRPGQRMHYREVVEHLEQICEALDAAHKVGVVHRDLKPENIFIVSNNPLKLKVMDFGVAKSSTEMRSGQTLHGQVLGTPTHMAPEQALGQIDRISPHTDLYGVGVIGYQMLTGRLPFVADSAMMLLSMHIRDPVPLIRNIAPEVPTRIAQLIECCLAKDPSHRPRSARVLATQLVTACRVADLEELSRNEAQRNEVGGSAQELQNKEEAVVEALAQRLATMTSKGQPVFVDPGVRVQEKPPSSRRGRDGLSTMANGAAPLLIDPADGYFSTIPPTLQREEMANWRNNADKIEQGPASEQRPVQRISLALPEEGAQQSADDVSSPNSQRGATLQSSGNARVMARLAARRAELQEQALAQGDVPPVFGMVASERSPIPVPRTALLSEVTDDATEEAVQFSASDGAVLERLLRRMQRRGDFPSFLNHMAEIVSKADANGQYSAAQLAEALRKDFGLTAKLLKVVNNAFMSRFKGRVYSVHQAVVILGFDSVRSVASGVLVYKVPGTVDVSGKHKIVEGKYNSRLAESAINALVSGEIARLIASSAKLRVDAELAMMTAIFRNIGQHLVMQYLPEEFEKIELMMERENVSLLLASERVLGLPLRKLGCGVLGRWQLPRTLCDAVASQTRPEQVLERETDRLGALARFATDLADLVSRGGQVTWGPSVQRLLERNRNLLSMDERQVGELLAVITKSFEDRFAALIGPYCTKSRFFNNARELTKRVHLDVDPAAPAVETPDDQEPLEAFIEKLDEGLQSRREPDKLAERALKRVARALNVRRVFLLVTSADKRQLDVRAGVGEEVETIRPLLKLSLMQVGNVFASAISSNKPIVVDDAFSPRNTKRVPQPYYEVIGSPCFVVVPCTAVGLPGAVLLLDVNVPEQLPNEEKLASIKSLRGPLVRLAHRLSGGH
jgi:serine/threonine protein kinase/HD-like signal output (HDOD) protein